MTLIEVISGYFIVRRRHLASTTRTNYNYAFRRLCHYFGEERDFAAIAPQDIDDYIKHLHDDELADRSVRDNVVICSTLWTFAHEEFGYAHLVKEVAKPEYTEKEILPFTESEIKAIAEAAEWTTEWNTRAGKQVRSHRPTWRRDVALIVLLLDTCLRVSEASGLKMSDYDNESGRLIVRHGKGNKQRAVFLGDTAQRTLWRYLMSRDKIKPSDPSLLRATARYCTVRTSSICSNASATMPVSPTSTHTDSATPLLFSFSATEATFSSCSAFWATPNWRRSKST